MDPQFAFPENWTAPRELTRALPRETSMTGRGIFMAIDGVDVPDRPRSPCTWMHNQPVQTASAQNEALRTQGREAHRRDRAAVAPRQGAAYPWWAMRSPPMGSAFTGESSVPEGIWAGVQKAGFLPVRYLPSDPKYQPSGRLGGRTTEPAWVPFLSSSDAGGGRRLSLINLRRQALWRRRACPRRAWSPSVSASREGGRCATSSA
jgi:hypothetical protein